MSVVEENKLQLVAYKLIVLNAFVKVGDRWIVGWTLSIGCEQFAVNNLP